MATVSDTLGFVIPSWPPKMAGVSDTPGFLSHLGTPRRQVYQIHLVFYPILAPQDGRCIRYTWFSIPSWHPRRQVYQIHLVFDPILAPQDGRCIRYTWFSIPSWHPKTAGVSDTPGFLSHLGTPRRQVYQIHLVFYHLGPQDGRCIRYTWFSIPSWHPKTEGVSDTLIHLVLLSHLGPLKMAGVSDTPTSPNVAPATKSHTPTSPNVAPATKSHTPTSPNVAPATKSHTPTSPNVAPATKK